MKLLRARIAQLWLYWTSDALGYSTPLEETAVLARRLRHHFHHDTDVCILSAEEVFFPETIELLRAAGWDVQIYVDDDGIYYYIVDMGVLLPAEVNGPSLIDRLQGAAKQALHRFLPELFWPGL